jgi:hypothetical protein
MLVQDISCRCGRGPRGTPGSLGVHGARARRAGQQPSVATRSRIVRPHILRATLAAGLLTACGDEDAAERAQSHSSTPSASAVDPDEYANQVVDASVPPTPMTVWTWEDAAELWTGRRSWTPSTN